MTRTEINDSIMLLDRMAYDLKIAWQTGNQWQVERAASKITRYVEEVRSLNTRDLAEAALNHTVEA